MKKILISLSVIGTVAAVAISGTMALFNDTETSTGNIFTAGSINLKVDHVWETYNDIDCKTCGLTLISDPTNMVVAKNGNSLAPYPAVYVGSNPPYFIHPAWTAEEDPLLVAAGAKWIWESDPTQQADTDVDTTYAFEKKFEWWGPIMVSDFEMAVGHDNTVEVWLNNVNIANGTHEQGYRQENMLHISGATITNNIVQGENVLRFIVKNSAWPGGHFANPAGLIYKFAIGGACENDYFRSHCTLWGEKDLAPGDYFWNFTDVKPGDHGTNVISLHVFDNDAYSCLLVNDTQDNENNLTNPEANAGDDTSGPTSGELSQFINVFVWDDINHNGIYEPAEETQLLASNTPVMNLNLLNLSLSSASTAYVGLAWCVGTQTVAADGTVTCSGSGNQDIAQTDSFLTSLTAYAVQQRNNEGFTCASVELPTR